MLCLSVGGCISLGQRHDRQRGASLPDEGVRGPCVRCLQWLPLLREGLEGTRQSGLVLVIPMRDDPKLKGALDIARYYATRGKLVGVDDEHVGSAALACVSYRGYLDIVAA